MQNLERYLHGDVSVKMPWAKPKKQFVGPNYERLQMRSEHMSNEELMGASELSVSSLNRYVTHYRQTRDLDCAAEIKLAAETLYMMADELYERRYQEMVERGEIKPARQRNEMYGN